mmetsp:Transcript_54188/g.141174  ORF Transcript_54188/g.141174 Transcript_54188/m.141174 type:complete len:226 (+) Transcript_54188:51-728(+)
MLVGCTHGTRRGIASPAWHGRPRGVASPVLRGALQKRCRGPRAWAAQAPRSVEAPPLPRLGARRAPGHRGGRSPWFPARLRAPPGDASGVLLGGGVAPAAPAVGAAPAVVVAPAVVAPVVGAPAVAATVAGPAPLRRLQVRLATLQLLLDLVGLFALLLKLTLLLVDELLGHAHGALLGLQQVLPQLGAEGRRLALHEARQVDLQRLRVDAFVSSFLLLLQLCQA